MVLELARSAIYIKMAAKVECPIISAYEYCFAAGLAFSKMHVSEDKKNEIRDLESFSEMKQQVSELVQQSDVWSGFEHGDRLKNMLTGCRVNATLDEQTKELFDQGYQEI